MFWDYGGPKAGIAGSAGAASKANGTAQKLNGVPADGAFGTTMSPDFKVRSVASTALQCTPKLAHAYMHASPAHGPQMLLHAHKPSDRPLAVRLYLQVLR